MTQVLFKGNAANTSGNLPKVGDTLPAFSLVGADLSEKTLKAYAGKVKILSIFPSIDTGVCATSVRRFNTEASHLENTVVLCISKDLPFAQKRFCGQEGLSNVETLSAFRSSFATDYGVELLDTALKGLCSRAIVVADESDKVIYVELVSEVTEEPNYEAALAVLSVA